MKYALRWPFGKGVTTTGLKRRRNGERYECVVPCCDLFRFKTEDQLKVWLESSIGGSREVITRDRARKIEPQAFYTSDRNPAGDWYQIEPCRPDCPEIWA